jgi:8-oxo-dGTP pyrophosphatase MutT (NUDIX family)
MDHQMSRTADMPMKYGAGCVVYRWDAAGVPLLLLIHDKYGNWTLPKGHLKDGESEQAAAVREVLEETGISGSLGPLVGRIVYTVPSKKIVARPKQVAFFLMHTSVTVGRPQPEEGIRAVEWFGSSEALALVGYSQIREILLQALNMIAC